MFHNLYCRSQEKISTRNYSKVSGRPTRIKTRRPFDLAIRWSVVTYEKWKQIFLKFLLSIEQQPGKYLERPGMSTVVSITRVKNIGKKLGRGLSNGLKFIGNLQNIEILDELVVSKCFIYQFVISPPKIKDIRYLINISKCYKLMCLLHEKLIKTESNFTNCDMNFK